MSRTVQGGVMVGNVKLSIVTKKRLKEIVRDSPDLVNFYPTSEMGPQYKGRVADLPSDTTLLVVGPDPYHKRTWYANISKTQSGGFKVT